MVNLEIIIVLGIVTFLVLLKRSNFVEAFDAYDGKVVHGFLKHYKGTTTDLKNLERILKEKYKKGHPVPFSMVSEFQRASKLVGSNIDEFDDTLSPKQSGIFKVLDPTQIGTLTFTEPVALGSRKPPIQIRPEDIPRINQVSGIDQIFESIPGFDTDQAIPPVQLEPQQRLNENGNGNRQILNGNGNGNANVIGNGNRNGNGQILNGNGIGNGNGNGNVNGGTNKMLVSQAGQISSVLGIMEQLENNIEQNQNDVALSGATQVLNALVTVQNKLVSEVGGQTGIAQVTLNAVDSAIQSAQTMVSSIKLLLSQSVGDISTQKAIASGAITDTLDAVKLLQSSLNQLITVSIVAETEQLQISNANGNSNVTLKANAGRGNGNGNGNSSRVLRVLIPPEFRN